jgi:hypothetical protein
LGDNRISTVYTNTAYSNGVETQTDTTTTNGSLGTPLTSTAYLAADGSLQTNNISSGTIVNLPSTFAAGTTWIAAPAYATASATASAYIGTIESVGVACSSNSQTFTDCIKVNFSGSFTTTGTVNAGTYSFTGTLSQTQYYSPTVGNIVQFTTTTNGTYSGSVTGVETFIQSEQLQAGYIAN